MLNDVKSFWKYIRNKNETNGYPSIMYLMQDNASDTLSVANLSFKNNFSDIFSDSLSQ